MWYYKLSASPPIFIPFVGALINLRQNPPNAKVEAIVGIGGPVFGTIGSLACLAIYQWVPMFHNGDMLTLANFGFFLNLFNLIPVPPLDGGRVTAAVSPWIWIAGLAGLALMFFNNIRHGNFAIIPLAIILVYGLPRVLGSISSRVRNSPYYRIGARASWTIGIAYLALAGLLFVMKVYTARMGQDLL
jgi:Zn-dependent protease